MILSMANDTTTAPAGPAQAPPVTMGERLAGVAGVITATAILLICLDMALGGKLSGQVSARLSQADAAGLGLNGDGGGCGC
jgi:hypothetical protein